MSEKVSVKKYQLKRIEAIVKILIACEFSGIVRDAFEARGHDAWSCDLLPTEKPGQHIQGNVLEILDNGWDMMIAHPPCTYLANSGVQHMWRDRKKANGKNVKRWEKMNSAKEFFLHLLYANIDKIVVENPVPHGYAQLPKYDQIIEPFQHGHETTKRTCLWVNGLPLLQPSNIVPKGERYIGKNGKSNGSAWYQRESLKDRWKIRSRTFPGIAQAMAEQWG